MTNRVLLLVVILATLVACAKDEMSDDSSNSAAEKPIENAIESPLMRLKGVFAFYKEHLDSEVDAESLEVQLWRLKEPDSGSTSSIDVLQTVSVVDGKFELSVPVESVQHGGLSVSANGGEVRLGKLSLILEPGLLTVDVNRESLEGGRYQQKIYGWRNTAEYRQLHQQMNELVEQRHDVKTEAEEQERIAKWHQAYEAMKNLAQNNLALVINDDPDPVTRYLALTTFEAGLSTEQRVERLESLKLQLPGYQPLADSIARYQKSLEAKKRRNAIKVGTVIKDFEARDLSGSTFRVRDVMARNKYVLVEFWASWCGPCRAEIPHMKQAYKHFNSKGFEIVSFTLDDDEESWQEASDEEQIPWINVGDLQAHSSPIVQMYGVQGIPANYLVEGATGKIVGKNLRQRQLDERLSELLED